MVKKMATSETGRSITESELAVHIDQDACSRCAVCISTCPYEAIVGKSTQNKLEEVKIDPDKCQVCGICASSCPSDAIKTIYFDSGVMRDLVTQVTDEKISKNLVLACKSNGPSADEIRNLSRVRSIGDYEILRVPCLGRVSPDTILQVIASNTKRLVLVPCEEELCKFKEGSKKLHHRFLLLQSLIDQLGYDSNLLVVEENSVKAEISQSNCISCMNCLYACKYDAIKLNGKDTPAVDSDLCVGCGVCVGICPAITIHMKGYDSTQIDETIVNMLKTIKRDLESDKLYNILIMYCQWCNFSDLSNNVENIIKNKTKNGYISYLSLPCLGRLDSINIIQALYSGFDGVLAIGCKKDSCKMDKIKGNEVAESRIIKLKAILKQLSLEKKVAVDFVRVEYVKEFSNSINSFIDNCELNKKEDG
jgi:coenzyme F420-reducing hydrogenase delta subunit